jgi:hypothetical protein
VFGDKEAACGAIDVMKIYILDRRWFYPGVVGVQWLVRCLSIVPWQVLGPL